MYCVSHNSSPLFYFPNNIRFYMKRFKVKKILVIYNDCNKKSKFLILIYVLLAFLLQGVIISIPLVFAKIIVSAIYFEGMETFFRYVLIGLGIQLMALIASPIASYNVNKIGADSTALLKIKLLTRIPVIKYETLKNTSTGDILQLIESDLETTQSLVISDIVDFISKVVYFIVVFIIVMKLHFTLSILKICVVPILIIISKVMIPKLQECQHEYI